MRFDAKIVKMRANIPPHLTTDKCGICTLHEGGKCGMIRDT